MRSNKDSMQPKKKRKQKTGKALKNNLTLPAKGEDVHTLWPSNPSPRHSRNFLLCPQTRWVVCKNKELAPGCKPTTSHSCASQLSTLFNSTAFLNSYSKTLVIKNVVHWLTICCKLVLSLWIATVSTTALGEPKNVHHSSCLTGKVWKQPDSPSTEEWIN